MAPEFPPRLVLIDLRFEGDELAGRIHLVEIERPERRLRVRCDVTSPPAGFTPVAGGVVYVETGDGIHFLDYDARMAGRGQGTWSWQQGLPPGYAWLMLVLVLPAGHTIASSRPPPVTGWRFGERIALYWTMPGDALGRTELVFSLALLQRALAHEIERLNRGSVELRADTGVDLLRSAAAERPPRVFISYSHESPVHAARVLALSERLRGDGIETSLDQYVAGTPDEIWARWMMNQVDWADFVLVVCTETYHRRFRGREAPGSGRGVGWEGGLITQEMYDAPGAANRFVPVVLERGQEAHVPEPLRGRTSYLVADEARYRALCDFLLGQAGVQPRPVGVPRRDAERARPVCEPTLAAFVGPTERGPAQPTLVSSLDDYLAIFGAAEPAASFLAPALRGYFANGGMRALVVRVGGSGTRTASAIVRHESSQLHIDAITAGAWGNRIEVHLRPGTRTGVRLTIACPSLDVEDYDNASLTHDLPNPLVERVNARSKLVRLAWLGVTPPTPAPPASRVGLEGGSDGEPLTAADYAAGLAALAAHDIDLLCVPDHVHPGLGADDRDRLTDAVVERTRTLRCFALLATPAGEHTLDGLRPRHDAGGAALYYPWLREHGKLIPPIGHMAGAYARSDARRGRHRGSTGDVLDGLDADGLAHDADPELRDALVRLGINVLGLDPSSRRPALPEACTLAIDEDARHVPTVRLLQLLERQLTAGLRWVMFEPSERAVHERIVTEVTAYLHELWEDQVLTGSAADEAYFVRCDDTTMTADDVANGRIIVQIGVGLAHGRVGLRLQLQAAAGR